MNEQLNTFELSRTWFNYGFDNPDKIKPIHSAIYFFAIEHCNRLGWKQKFGFPSQMVMEAIGVKNWRTYSRGLNDLVEFGFINMIEISKNQYSSNIIAIVKNAKAPTKAPTKALDKALQKHSTKHSQSTVSITKQYNKEQRTIKENILNNNIWIEQISINKRLSLDKVKDFLKTFLDDLELKDDLDKSEKNVKQHFVNWLNGEIKKEAPKKDKPFKYEF